MLESQIYRNQLGKLGISIINQFYNEDHINEKLVNFYSMFANNETVGNPALNDEANKLIEMKLNQFDVKQISENEFEFRVDCTDYSNLEFAWHMVCGRETVDKIKYSSSPELKYRFDFLTNEKYQVKCFIRNKITDQKVAFPLAEISQNNFVKSFCTILNFLQ